MRCTIPPCYRTAASLGNVEGQRTVDYRCVSVHSVLSELRIVWQQTLNRERGNKNLATYEELDIQIKCINNVEKKVAALPKYCIRRGI